MLQPMPNTAIAAVGQAEQRERVHDRAHGDGLTASRTEVMGADVDQVGGVVVDEGGVHGRLVAGDHPEGVAAFGSVTSRTPPGANGPSW